MHVRSFARCYVHAMLCCSIDSTRIKAGGRRVHTGKLEAAALILNGQHLNDIDSVRVRALVQYPLRCPWRRAPSPIANQSYINASHSHFIATSALPSLLETTPTQSEARRNESEYEVLYQKLFINQFSSC
jgi:hypothetical protein